MVEKSYRKVYVVKAVHLIDGLVSDTSAPPYAQVIKMTGKADHTPPAVQAVTAPATVRVAVSRCSLRTDNHSLRFPLSSSRSALVPKPYPAPCPASTVDPVPRQVTRHDWSRLPDQPATCCVARRTNLAIGTGSSERVSKN